VEASQRVTDGPGKIILHKGLVDSSRAITRLTKDLDELSPRVPEDIRFNLKQAAERRRRNLHDIPSIE
jgi:hypothetical protein